MTTQLRARNSAQIREALSDLNCWYAGRELGRSPTPQEAVMHYIEHGGAENYAKRVAGEQSKSQTNPMPSPELLPAVSGRMHPDDVQAIVSGVVEGLRTQPAGFALPIERQEITAEEARALTGHKSRAALYAWLKLKRVRPVRRGYYARRKILAALAA